MRCPKCGFISFDLIESCVKCGKNISNAATELQGTVAGVAPPVFLRMSAEEAYEEASADTAVVDTEEPLDLGAEGEEEVMDFSFDEEPPAETEEVELNLEEAEEAAPDLDLGFSEEVVEEPETDEVIGISDLAPSEEAEEMVPEEPSPEEFEVAAEEADSAGGGQGLEDLKVEGIDLESTPGVSDSGKVMPSVKTGTALDDFDIDLGDLITSKKD